ncbi:MAG: hypothetical protein HQL14_02045 [Candidatus Omnitrophica bacterium]|nr:hypothetical protein [Candidatus Omnitrophota bacterium]
MSGQRIFLKPEAYFRSLANGRLITDLDNLVGSIFHYDPIRQRDLFKKRQELIDDYARKQGSIKSLMSWFRLNIYEENIFTLDKNKQHLNEILNAIALRYDTWHPDDPLKSVDIIEGIIDISQPSQARPTFSNGWHLSLKQGGQ